MYKKFRHKQLYSQCLLISLLCLAVVFVLSSCASPKTEVSQNNASGGDDSIKVGILHSLSGTMSISEVSVKDAEILAIDEINGAGGVLGKKIEPIIEVGGSEWT